MAETWQSGLEDETIFWRWYLTNHGGELHGKDYHTRLDPEAPLQEIFLPYLNAGGETTILDVGAGPLTFINKKSPSPILITAVDPLATAYDALLTKVGLEPVIRTVYGLGEALSDEFAAFDIVYSHNALDHAADPAKCLEEMLRVTRLGGVVILQVYEDEATYQAGHGLHRWNFSVRLDPPQLWLGMYRAAKTNIGAALQDAGGLLLGVGLEGRELTAIFQKVPVHR